MPTYPATSRMFQSVLRLGGRGRRRGQCPSWLRFGMCDHLATVSSVLACLFAVYHRDRTGAGRGSRRRPRRRDDLTASGRSAASTGPVLDVVRLDHEQTGGLAPEHRIYSCRDGWLAVSRQRLPDEIESFRARDRSRSPSSTSLTGRSKDAADRLCGRPHPARAGSARTRSTRCSTDPSDRADAPCRPASAHRSYGRVEQSAARSGTSARTPASTSSGRPVIGERRQGEILSEVGLDEEASFDRPSQADGSSRRAGRCASSDALPSRVTSAELKRCVVSDRGARHEQGRRAGGSRSRRPPLLCSSAAGKDWPEGDRLDANCNRGDARP